MNQFEMFDAYRRENAQNHNANFCDMDYLLRFWKENKGQYLTKIFGNQLILEKSVVYNQAKDELMNHMSNMIYDSANFIDSVMDKVAKFMNVTINAVWNYEHEMNYRVWCRLRDSLYSSYAMVENVMQLGYYYDKNDDRKDIKSYTIDFDNGHKVQIQDGMKITRIFAQICKNIGMEDEWEAFRIRHSQILNTKSLKGTLCLSIHPLDYATASDNDNGWSSCMSWREEGCYRMGTIEMMNSPMVICAYLKSDKQHMTIDGQEWNSKKWRAWIIVNKDVIVCNRHYPYHQSDLAKMCIEWVRELVGTHMGWTYDETHEDFYRYMSTIDHEIEFQTNYMYNDMGGDDVIGCMNINSKIYVINFSGPAECMVCGEYIAPNRDNQPTGAIECYHCDSHLECCHCGCVIDDEDNAFTDPDGNTICSDCFDNTCCYCDECGDVMWYDNASKVSMPLMPEIVEKYKNIFPANSDMHHMLCHDSYTDPRTLCENCVRDLNLTDWNINGREWITVPEPEQNEKEHIMLLLNCFGYDTAAAVVNTGLVHSWYRYDFDYYKSVFDFWNENFDAFAKEFANQSED